MLMFGFIKSVFDASRNNVFKARSCKEFVALVKRAGGDAVTMKVCSAGNSYGKATAGTGVMADFGYVLKFESALPNKKEVVYEERIAECPGGDCGGPSYAKNRNNAAIRAFLFAEQKAKEIQAELPGAVVNLVCANDYPIDCAALHRDAEACGVSV